MGTLDQQAQDTQTAGVIARPPFIFLGAILLGLVLDYLLPLPTSVPGGEVGRWIGAGVLLAIGAACVAGGFRNFTGAGTPVPTNQPTRALVTTGIHGWSRNPMYVGLFCLYAGIGLAAHSAWMAIFLLPLMFIMRYGVVAREERYLEERFGDSYRDYKARVRRWL